MQCTTLVLIIHEFLNNYISPINIPRAAGWSLDLVAVTGVSSLEAEAVSMPGNKERLSAEEQESERERGRSKDHVIHITHCFFALILKADCWK